MYFTEIDGVRVEVPEEVTVAVHELMDASYAVGAAPRGESEAALRQMREARRKETQALSRALQTFVVAMVAYRHGPLVRQLTEAQTKLRLAEEAAREARSWCDEALLAAQTPTEV